MLGRASARAESAARPAPPPRSCRSSVQLAAICSQLSAARGTLRIDCNTLQLAACFSRHATQQSHALVQCDEQSGSHVRRRVVLSSSHPGLLYMQVPDATVRMQHVVELKAHPVTSRTCSAGSPDAVASRVGSETGVLHTSRICQMSFASRGSEASVSTPCMSQAAFKLRQLSSWQYRMCPGGDLRSRLAPQQAAPAENSFRAIWSHAHPAASSCCKWASAAGR